jgi:hypothetical protein
LVLEDFIVSDDPNTPGGQDYNIHAEWELQ